MPAALGAPSFVLLPIPTVPGCDDLCRVNRVLYFISIYTSCARYAPKFVVLFMPIVPGCDELCRICGLLYFCLCQLWRPVPGMWIVLFLPMPAVPGPPSFVFLPIPTVPGCDNLCLVCGSLKFYLYQLWRPVPGKQRVIFLPLPAVSRALVLFFFLCYLCQVCRLL